MKNLANSGKHQALIVALFLFAMYLIAFFFPDSFWGLHFPSFLSDGKGLLLILAGLAFTIFCHRYDIWIGLEQKEKNGYSWFWITGVTIIAGLFYYNLPIYEDSYGDAMAILPDKDVVVETFADQFKEKLQSFDFTNLKLGTGTTFGLVGWMSYSQEITVYDAFRQLGVICGMGFVFFMLASVFSLAKNNAQRLLLSFIVIGTPMSLAFCGHIEVYGPVYFSLAIFWFVILQFLKKPSISLGLLLPILCLLNMKFHVTGFLTLFISVVAIVLALRKHFGKSTYWKQIGLFCLLPVFSIGIVIYLFVTKSVFGPREFTETNLTDAIFLPIKSSDPAPLDRYNLFSWNHFFDYFNLFFLWSASALLVVSIALIFRRKKINWNLPIVQLTGTALIVYVAVFFVLNPLLSMSTDWDLMSIPGIVLMLFAGSLVYASSDPEKQERSLASISLAPVIGLALIGWTTIVVNANQESLAQRMLSMGKYNFKTYWMGSSTPIFTGLELLDEEEQLGELELLVEELAPYAVDGQDIEYAALLNRLGKSYENERNDLDAAFRNYKRAFAADPFLRINVFDLVVAYFKKGEFKEANKLLPRLVAMQYPTPRKSLRIAIHTSLEAEDYVASENYCEQFLKLIPDDAFIQEIERLLQESKDKSQIKFMFRQN